MKKYVLVLMLIAVLALPVFAGDNEIYYSTYLILDSEVESSLEIERESGASIDYINAELYFFPKEDKRQKVLNIETEPEAKASEDKFVFRWENPSDNLLRYKVVSSVQVENKFEKVYNKIDFPLNDDLPLDVVEYINPTEKIDSGSRDVVGLANSLAEGEDDLFILIHKMATWVKENIEYDLNTVTEEATQKASWVLENRYGVCDELTALFMAMARSLGIPARFVSGVSYTNDPQFEQKWGGHGWSEVYLPGYGWVPFDVTYGELGWIDPSHIKLSESIDPDRPSGRIEWKGRNFEINAGKINVDAEIKETGGRILDTVDITAKAAKRKTGFGSYTLAEADIKNLRNYYVTTDISLSAPEEVEIEGEQNRQLILKPGETKKIFWILKVSQSLDRNYIYTFPVIAYNQRNTTDSTQFEASYGNPVYSRKEISSLLEMYEEEDEKTYSKELELSCDAEKDEFYAYEENSLSCVLENKGNTVLNNLNVCFGNNCRKTDLMITKKEDFEFEIRDIKEGERDLIITAGNQDVGKTEYVNVMVLDIPNATIAELEYPPEVNYDDQDKISFTVMKESFSSLYNAKVKVESKRARKTWTLSEIEATKKFILDFHAKDLADSYNDFSIVIEYEDRNGNQYSIKKDFKIKLVGLSLLQKLIVRVKGAGFFFSNLVRYFIE